MASKVRRARKAIRASQDGPASQGLKAKLVRLARSARRVMLVETAITALPGKGVQTELRAVMASPDLKDYPASKDQQGRKVRQERQELKGR